MAPPRFWVSSFVSLFGYHVRFLRCVQSVLDDAGHHFEKYGRKAMYKRTIAWKREIFCVVVLVGEWIRLHSKCSSLICGYQCENVLDCCCFSFCFSIRYFCVVPKWWKFVSAEVIMPVDCSLFTNQNLARWWRVDSHFYLFVNCYQNMDMDNYQSMIVH